jgi:hypothetical protein
MLIESLELQAKADDAERRFREALAREDATRSERLAAAKAFTDAYEAATCFQLADVGPYSDCT